MALDNYKKSKGQKEQSFKGSKTFAGKSSMMTSH
jgi:hypothetical protein